jgi:hypothetical protein
VSFWKTADVVKIFIFCLLTFLIPKSAVCEDRILIDSHENFTQEIRRYFDSYYTSIQTGNNFRRKQDVIEDIQRIASNYINTSDGKIDCEDINSIKGLNCWIGNYLKESNQIINIFVVEEQNVINCWLGYLAESSSGREEIWGKTIEFKINVLDDMIVQDFKHWTTKGMDAYEAGTRGNTLFLNIPAFRIKAEEVYQFMESVSQGQYKRRYDSSEINKLRKRLRYKAWSDLYLDSLNQFQDNNKQKEIFIEKYIKLKKENTFYHELGHIFAVTTGLAKANVDEEIIAILTELKYGSLPYDSMEFLVSTAWVNDMTTYNLAGAKILKKMAEYTERGSIRQELNIAIPWESKKMIEKVKHLSTLNENDIRDMSDQIYNNLFNR